MTTNDSRLTLDSIKQAEGLKLMHMYESYCYDMKHGRVIDFGENDLLSPVTPNDPG